MTLQWIVEKISQIPAEFWGAITGASIALAGTWLSNRSSRQHLRIQLEESAKESEKQRLYDLKKSLILECQVAMTKARKSLSTPSAGSLPTYPEVADAMEKLSLLELIAGDNTLERSIELKAIYSTAIVELMRIATPIVSCSTQIESTRLIHSDISKEIQTLIKELQNIDRTKAEGVLQTDRLSMRLDLYSKRAEEIEERIEKLYEEFDNLTTVYHAELEPIITTIPHPELTLVAALRDELGLPPQKYLMRHQPSLEPDLHGLSPVSPTKPSV
jgi:hypothetical protein